MDLIGRTAEQRDLRQAWDGARQGDPQLAVLWGRRRVGKTFLLTHFAEGKRAIYFTATRQDHEERQLRRFASRVREQLSDELRDLAPDSFSSWEAALRFVVQLAVREPLLLVIDEAPRLLAGTPDFADLVSAVWENHVRTQRIMLVISGSAVSVMEEMLGAHGGLHRRATLERRMDPFPAVEARKFLPNIPPADFIEAYAACGGYPLHLRRWGPEQSVAENLSELAFTPGGVLLRDAVDIMSEDLDWRGGYERVLAAMAGGARRRSRIASRAQQRIDHTLDRLHRAGYVRTVHSIGSAGSTDPLYEIADDYLAFWFAAVRDDADLIEGGQGAAVRKRTIGRWQAHIGKVFEATARAHAQLLVARGEFPQETIVGRWWRDEIAEIDVLGLAGDEPVLVGECKWQAKPVTLRDIAELRAKAAQLPPAPATFCYWSRGPLAPDVAEYPDVRGFGPAEMIEG